MPTYIFDLNSPCDNGEIYLVEVKVGSSQTGQDIPTLDKNSDDPECEKKPHHKDSPFTLDQENPSKKIATPDKTICYRFNGSKWYRATDNGGTNTISI